ncbi:MAG: (2Fe-2S)-binding protein [Acidobacteriota bacterium]
MPRPRARGRKRAGRGAAVSRREFLKGLGAGGALGAGLLGAGGAACRTERRRGEAARFGPGAGPIRLTVNGRTRTVRVEPRVTLLDALRDRLDLTGTKKICDRGECGGCTVLLDGLPVYACMMLAVEARDRAITTVEGLAPAERLHPLQEAFVERDALQCGFCTPGFLVASKALLDRNPGPSREQVRRALGGHICRCGTYPRVIQAVLDVAARSGGRAARHGGARSGTGP